MPVIGSDMFELRNSIPQTRSTLVTLARNEAIAAERAARENRRRLRLRWRIARAKVTIRRAKAEIREAKEAYRCGR